MYPEDTFAGKSLTENHRIEERAEIESFLSDLGVEVPEKLESDSRDSSEYTLYATIGLQGSFNESYAYDLVHNDVVSARFVGDLHYKDDLVARIEDRYRSPAYDVFPASTPSSSEYIEETEAELDSKDEALAE